jgi:hypothetical protein
MELKSKENTDLRAMAATWAATPNTELEAMVPDLDLTGWQDIVQYLRSLGFTESKRDIKLNVCIDDKAAGIENMRFTIDGEDAIQAYCRDEILGTYTAMIKEPVAGMAPITLAAYGTRIKLKRELALGADDSKVISVVSRWPTVRKYFRQIQRYEFSRSDIGLRFDLSVVRANEGLTFQAARIPDQVAGYEAEVELLSRGPPDAAFRLICRGLGLLLQGRQRSFVLISKAGAAAVVAALKARFGPAFPGPQPVTLQKKDLEKIQTYNVTDKADGLRCLLCVLDGRVYLVDGGFRVYATGLTSSVDAVLDGEWIRRVGYYAFDCLTDGPFLANAGGRWAAMRDAVAAIKPNEKIPAHEALVVRMKEFRMGPDAAAATLDAVKPYKTDGLIFTPDDAQLPKGGTWAAQFKWKPAHENTIDFLVVIEPRRVDGVPQKDDLVETGEHHGHMVSYKTLGLFVGKSVGGMYKPAPFSKSPIAYVAIGEGRSDPSGASAAIGDEIYTKAREVIHTNTIVEMAYDMESKEPEAWRWIPLRIRHDKTERYRAGQKGSTMNAEHVANSNWDSIHNPVTEDMIRGIVSSVIPLETPVIPLTTTKKTKVKAASEAVPTAASEAVPTAASEAVPTAASEAVPTKKSRKKTAVPEATVEPTAEAEPTVKKSRKKTVAPTAPTAPTGPVFLVNAKQETSTILEPGWSKYLAVTTKYNEDDSVQAAVSARKADFPADAWKPEQYRLYQLYLKQRYDNDEKFRAMIDTIKAANGTILYANGSAKEQDLGMGVVNGEVVGGQNLLGTWMTALS